MDLVYQTAVCLTNSHVDYAFLTGEADEIQVSAAFPIQPKPASRRFIYVVLGLVAILILLAAVFLPEVNISALFESPEEPTARPSFTRTPTVVLLVESVLTATSPHLSFPLIIRQPTATPLPTSNFTTTPTVTQTPVPTNTPRIYIQPTSVRQTAPTKAPPPTDPPVLEPTPPASRP